MSYFVDEFVKREVLYKSDLHNLEIATELLSLSRFERRIVGKQFFEFAERYKDKSGLFLARRYGKVNDLVIGFLLHGKIIDDEKVLAFMNLAINGYCYYEKYKSKKIILITTSNDLTRLKFGYVKDVEPFSSDFEEDIIHDLKVLNWFQRIEEIKFNIQEYPDQ